MSLDNWLNRVSNPSDNELKSGSPLDVCSPRAEKHLIQLHFENPVFVKETTVCQVRGDLEKFKLKSWV